MLHAIAKSVLLMVVIAVYALLGIGTIFGIWILIVCCQFGKIEKYIRHNDEVGQKLILAWLYY